MAANQPDGRAAGGSIWADGEPPAATLLAGILAAASEHALFATDPNGTVRLWSKGAADMFGRPENAVIGQQAWWDVCAPGPGESGERENGPWRAPLDTAAGGGSWTGVVTGLRADGGRPLLRAAVSPLPGVGGRRAGYLTMCVDVTGERQRAGELEEALRRARRRFDDCVLPMCITDMLGIITEANKAVHQFGGWRRDELIGRPITDFATEQERAVATFARALREGKATKQEFGVRRADGTVLGAQVSGSVLTDEDGRPQEVLVTNTDMSEEIRVREQLRKERDHYRGLIEASVDGMVALDAEGFIVDVTHQVCQMSGFEREELVGSRFADWFADPELTVQTVERARAGGESCDAELRLVNRAGSERTVLVRCRPGLAKSGERAGVAASIRDITELTELREQLAHERAYARRVLDGSGGGIIISDLGLRVADVNVGACELTGQARDALVGTDLWRLFSDPHEITEVVDRALLTGQVSGAPLRLAGDRPVTATVTVLRGPTGDVEGVLTALLDVAESAALAERLAAAEAYARTIVEASPVALIGADRDGTITDVNRAGEELTGLPRQRLMGRRVVGLFADPDAVRAFVEETYRRRYVTDYELDLVPAARPPVTVAVYGGLVADPRTQQEHLLLAVRDITAEKATREGLHLYIQSLYRATTDALVLIDLRGRITDVNRQMEVVTGRSRSELTGVMFEDCCTDRARGHQFVDSVLREGQIADVELTVRRPDGAETVLWYNAGTFTDTGGKLQGIFASARDVTERNRLQQLQAQMLDRAQELDRAKSEFVSRISHELRSPLTSVMGYLEVLREDERPGLTDEQRQMLDIMARNTQRLLSLIEDLLLMSRIESGIVALSYDRVDLGGLLGTVRESFLPAIERGGLTSRFEAAAPVTIDADPHQLERALTNLVSNAVKFTPAGGQISVVCRRDGEDAVIEVSDTGMGIPKPEQPKLFSRFFRSSLSEERETQGTGLGLYIVKNVIDAHGGSVTVDSEPGAGTVFTVRLPVRRPGLAR